MRGGVTDGVGGGRRRQGCLGGMTVVFVRVALGRADDNEEDDQDGHKERSPDRRHGGRGECASNVAVSVRRIYRQGHTYTQAEAAKQYGRS